MLRSGFSLHLRNAAYAAAEPLADAMTGRDDAKTPLPQADREAFEVRKAFTRFLAEDADALAGMRETLERHADEVVERFYEHLQRFEPLAQRLTDPDLVRRLKGVQRDYLVSLVAGDYGPDYAKNRIGIGQVHDRIGLDPDWFIGGYGRYLELLAPVIAERHAGDVPGAVAATTAVAKLMFLDTQLVLDSYWGLREKRAVARSEQLAAVGQLAASIAHEVRNPLAGMKGALQVLRKQLEANAENQEIVEELLAQIERLENLVRDLLTYARPRALRRQRFDLHELLDRLTRAPAVGGDGGEVSVVRTYGRGTVEMDADPTQMEQVFLNLIHNAMQAMETGGRLSVETRAAEREIEVTFRDSGKGIDPLDLPRVFEPFFTTKHRGSGLGLPIVSKIVAAHGGSIDVTSRPGQGTAVTVRLPFEEAGPVEES